MYTITARHTAQKIAIATTTMVVILNGDSKIRKEQKYLRMKEMPRTITIYLMKILSLFVPLENNNNNSDNNSKPPCDNEASPNRDMRV